MLSLFYRQMQHCPSPAPGRCCDSNGVDEVDNVVVVIIPSGLKSSFAGVILRMNADFALELESYRAQLTRSACNMTWCISFIIRAVRIYLPTSQTARYLCVQLVQYSPASMVLQKAYRSSLR